MTTQEQSRSPAIPVADRPFLAALAAGDEGAWRRFMADYGGVIHAALLRFPLAEAERKDLYQETCVRVLDRVEGVRDPARLSSWVFGIAYRLSIDTLRRRGRMVADHDFDREISPGPPPDAALAELEATVRVRDALARAPARCRALLHALYLEQPTPSYKEIGERLGMRIGSIGPTRARCLAKLRDEMSAQTPPEETPQ